MHKVVYLLLLGSLFLGACKKNSPEEPLEAVLKINTLETSVPIATANVCGTVYDNVLHLTSGTPLVIKFQFTGVHPLAQYKIDIHANFDCHAHEKRTENKTWSYLNIQDLEGNDVILTESIPLPEHTYSGNYHCMIRLIDVLGNEAPFLEFNVVVKNYKDDEAPSIHYSLPTSDSITVKKGDLITFKGTIIDNYSLKNGRLQITYSDKDNNHYTAINEVFPSEELLEYSFDRNYQVPSYILSGTALFKLEAFDESNNSSQRFIKVHVIE